MVTTLPAPSPAGTLSRPVRIAVVGPSRGLSGLDEQLPAGWSIHHVDPAAPELSLGRADVVIVTGASGAGITAVRRRYPGPPVIGIVDAAAPVERVVEVLEAGADTCVRSGLPALVASHLRACLRRRPTS